MALIVEDATGLATAESYASVAEADAYWLNHGSPAAWSGGSVTTDTKEDALRTASEWIDSRYGGRFKGSRKERLQRLYWPRYGVEIDLIALDVSPLPRQLKEATIELAKRHIDQVAEGATLADDVTDGTLASLAVSLGPISEAKTFLGGKPALKRFTVVERLLAPLLAKTGVDLERG